MGFPSGYPPSAGGVPSPLPSGDVYGRASGHGTHGQPSGYGSPAHDPHEFGGGSASGPHYGYGSAPGGANGPPSPPHGAGYAYDGANPYGSAPGASNPYGSIGSQGSQSSSGYPPAGGYGEAHHPSGFERSYGPPPGAQGHPYAGHHYGQAVEPQPPAPSHQPYGSSAGAYDAPAYPPASISLDLPVPPGFAAPRSAAQSSIDPSTPASYLLDSNPAAGLVPPDPYRAPVPDDAGAEDVPLMAAHEIGYDPQPSPGARYGTGSVHDPAAAAAFPSRSTPYASTPGFDPYEPVSVGEAPPPAPKFNWMSDYGVSKPPAGSQSSIREIALGVFGGVVAACIGGGLWAFIALHTGFELGVLATGVGWMAGVGVGLSGCRSDTAQLLAVVSVMAGLLLGKYLMIEWEVSFAQVAKEMAADDDVMPLPVLYEMAMNGEVASSVGERAISINLTATDRELAPAIGSLMSIYGDDVAARLKNMPTDERQRLAFNWLRDNLQRLSFWERVRVASSFHDILWFFLGLTVAWRVAGGVDD